VVKYNKMKTLLTVVLSFIAVAVLAQADTTVVTNPFQDGNLEGVVSQYELIYAALATLWGYAARALFKKESGDPLFYISIVAGAATIGGIFVWQELSDAISLTISFVISTKLYELAWKPIEKIITSNRVEQPKA
jgi:hypothetical protein